MATPRWVVTPSTLTQRSSAVISILFACLPKPRRRQISCRNRCLRMLTEPSISIRNRPIPVKNKPMELRMCGTPQIQLSLWKNDVRWPPAVNTVPGWPSYGRRIPQCADRSRSAIDDDHSVRVTLLGEEKFAMVGELFLLGVARDEGKEVRRAAVTLGPQDAAEPLGLLLPGAEHARNLDQQNGPLYGSTAWPFAGSQKAGADRSRFIEPLSRPKAEKNRFGQFLVTRSISPEAWPIRMYDQK